MKNEIEVFESETYEMWLLFGFIPIFAKITKEDIILEE